MVNKKQKKVIGTRRYFSEEVRREVVKRIERNELGVLQAAREYEVNPTSVYNWLYRYSLHLKKGNVLVVEKKSRTALVEQYRQRIAELERIIGQKQLEVDVLNKMLEIGSRELGFDIKKKYSGRLSSGSDSSENNIPTN